MRFRFIRAFAAVATLFGALAPTTSGAVRPEEAPDAGRLIEPVWTPLGVGKQPVTVVLQMAGDPVAVFCADAALWGDLAGDARLTDAVRRAEARVSAFVASAQP